MPYKVPNGRVFALGLGRTTGSILFPTSPGNTQNLGPISYCKKRNEKQIIHWSKEKGKGK